MVWLIVASIFVILCVLITFLSFRVTIAFERTEDNSEITITISTLRKIIHYSKTIELNFLQEPDKPQTSEYMTQSPLTKFKQLKGKWDTDSETAIQLLRVMKAFMSRLRCEHLRWQTVVGTGDAAETAIIVGWLWGIKSVSSSFVEKNVQMMTEPVLEVAPFYTGARLDCHFSCIVVFRLGQAIVTGIRIIVHLAIGRSKKKWQTTPSKA